MGDLSSQQLRFLMISTACLFNIYHILGVNICHCHFRVGNWGQDYTLRGKELEGRNWSWWYMPAFESVLELHVSGYHQLLNPLSRICGGHTTEKGVTIPQQQLQQLLEALRALSIPLTLAYSAPGSKFQKHLLCMSTSLYLPQTWPCFQKTPWQILPAISIDLNHISGMMHS